MKIKNIVKVILVFLSMAFHQHSFAQSIYFTFTNGTQAYYNLDSIRSITFNGNDVNIAKLDGTIISWNMSFIVNYRYTNTVGVDETSPIGKLIVYPNPTHGEINVSYELSSKEKVGITLADAKGSIIHYSPMKFMDKGIHNFSWNAQNAGVQSGVICLTIVTEMGLVTKNIILQ